MDNSNLRIYLYIAIPLIILLCYFIYKYNLNARTLYAISNMNYKDSIALEKMPNCYELDASMQYMLCDYYIASSYMTPCVGNQHYDYVSNEMIIEVLQSGARYIQLPICEATISPNATPVIATTQYGQKLITSLNTLDIKETLKIIRTNAFKIKRNVINYPLIIHFILNTNNTYTLNELSNNIMEILSDLLVDVTKYTTRPIYYEKMCNLLGKIILIATPEYQGSKLESFIVPTNKLFETFHYNDINAINSIKSNENSLIDYNKLSSKQQTMTDTIFMKKYPSLEYIINTNHDIGQQILSDTSLVNNLIQFNKIGMTVVTPNKLDDIISANYDPRDAVYSGCQFITMNYQINDDNMKTYMKIFNKSSFVLKPASMRYISSSHDSNRDSSRVVDDIYKSVIPVNVDVLNDIYYKYNNMLIALESYSNPDIYLTQSENNLRFMVGSVLSRDKFSNKKNTIGLDQCFIISKSRNKKGGEDIPLYLESVSRPEYFITLDNNTFILDKKINISSNNKQTFYFEKSSVDNLISVRTTNDDKKYIACENKIVKAYVKSPQIQMQNNTAFILHVIPFKIQVKIITLYDGSVKSMGSNILGVLENNISDGTPYIIEAVNVNSNFDYNRDYFYLKNAKTNLYVTYDVNTLFLYDNVAIPDTRCVFNFEISNGFYTLNNDKKQSLILYQNNLLKFIDIDKVISNENLFKIDLQYII